jgi:hypothetical protein
MLPIGRDIETGPPGREEVLMRTMLAPFLLVASVTALSAHDKGLVDQYKDKFVVVQREGLAVAICGSQPNARVRPVTVLIDGDHVEYDKKSALMKFALAMPKDEYDTTCDDVVSEPVHKGEVLSVHRVRIAHQRLDLEVRAISPHAVTRGEGAFQHESLERGSAIFAFQQPDPKNPNSVTSEVDTWLKSFDTEAEAAQFGNTASGAFVKEVKLGMTPADVEAVMGPPITKADLGEKVLYKYKDMTVEFHNGKVTDVR